MLKQKEKNTTVKIAMLKEKMNKYEFALNDKMKENENYNTQLKEIKTEIEIS